MRKALIQGFAYLIFLLVIPELFARVMFAIPVVASRLQADEETTYLRRWVARHRSGAEITYAFDMYDATKGWMTKPGLRDQRVFVDRLLNTNDKGLRGRREYSYSKPAGMRRVLVLGDSFTFGEEVSDTETYPHYLQTKFSELEVINMGVHGYGHDQMLILLEEEGVKYTPDVVILGFIAGDMHRNMLQFRDYAKPRFVLDGDAGLKLVGSPVPRPEEVMKWDWARPRLYDAWSLLRFRFMTWSGLHHKRMNRLTAAILDRMVATIMQRGATPLFVYIPTPREIIGLDKTSRELGFFDSYCKSKRELRCISVWPQLEARRKQGAKLKTTGHWDAFGNQVIADAILRYLDQKTLVDRTH
jgi:hypothetical protein